MTALYTVEEKEGGDTLSDDLEGTVRRYYIAAEEVEWNYAPQGGNGCSNPVQVEEWSEDALVFVEQGECLVGSTYLKGQYIGYTNSSFTTPIETSEEESYLGLLGPILKAEVGDTIEVVFLNRLRYPASTHPHGVLYSKSSEGSPYNDGTVAGSPETADDAVPTGERHTYRWLVPESAGPGQSDPDTILWMYHSHTNEITDTYAGLVGGIVIGRPGAFQKTGVENGSSLGLPQGIDKEVVLFFSVMNEGDSLFTEDNFNQSLSNCTETPLSELDNEPNLMHAINGYIYCNAPSLNFTLGQRVRFYTMALGTEVDMHTPNMAGSSWEVLGHRQPAQHMMPGVMRNADVLITNPPGYGVISCRVGDHITAGMMLGFQVTGGDGNSVAQLSIALNEEEEEGVGSGEGTVREYFISADEIKHDYAPAGMNVCTNEDFGEAEAVWVTGSPSNLGSIYIKAVYRGYSDGNFTTLSEMFPQQGILGPFIVANVGDTIKINFRNSVDFPVNLAFDGGLVTVQPAAVQADSEAASTTTAPHPVLPGEAVVYEYFVPPTAGPGPGDQLDTVVVGYTSSIDPVSHPNAGLVGMALIGEAGTFPPPPTTITPTRLSSLLGVDYLVPLLLTIVNENSSPYLDANIEEANPAVNATEVLEDEELMAVFEEGNLLHAFNGYIFCNMPPLNVTVGDVVRFAILGMGSEVDLHNVVFPGQLVLGQQHDVIPAAGPIMPTSSEVVDVQIQSPGRCVFSCILHDNLDAGMQGLLSAECPFSDGECGAFQNTVSSTTTTDDVMVAETSGRLGEGNSWSESSIFVLLFVYLFMFRF